MPCRCCFYFSIAGMSKIQLASQMWSLELYHPVHWTVCESWTRPACHMWHALDQLCTLNAACKAGSIRHCTLCVGPELVPTERCMKGHIWCVLLVVHSARSDACSMQHEGLELSCAQHTTHLLCPGCSQRPHLTSPIHWIQCMGLFCGPNLAGRLASCHSSTPLGKMSLTPLL